MILNLRTLSLVRFWRAWYDPIIYNFKSKKKENPDAEQQESLPPSAPKYNKKSSFFDSISTSREMQEVGRLTKEQRESSRQSNLNTFGVADARGGYRGGYRGRGGYQSTRGSYNGGIRANYNSQDRSQNSDATQPDTVIQLNANGTQRSNSSRGRGNGRRGGSGGQHQASYVTDFVIDQF